MSDERSGALATELRRRGLDVPALLLLHAHRPLRPLIDNLAIFISPLTRPLLGRAISGQAYDRLMRDLEDGEAGEPHG